MKDAPYFCHLLDALYEPISQSAHDTLTNARIMGYGALLSDDVHYFVVNRSQFFDITENCEYYGTTHDIHGMGHPVFIHPTYVEDFNETTTDPG